ncbi:DUF6228 family protein [Ralstonia nicotianae]
MADIKCSETAATLSLTLLGRGQHEIQFLARLRGAPFIGEVVASTYFNGPPSALFDDMAEYWTGWQGEKSWDEIDGALSLAATATSLGHVTLFVRMSANDGDYTATAVLRLEAGSLERIAEDVRAVFSP